MEEATLGGALGRDKRGGPGRPAGGCTLADRPTVSQGPGETGSTLGEERTATPLGAVIALSASISIGAVLLVGPLLWDRLPVTDLPFGFASHHQDAETLIYLVAFAVLVPLGVLVAVRVSDRVAAGPNASGLSALVALLTGGLALVVIATRLSGLEVLAAGATLWGALAAVTLVRAASSRPWRPLRGIEHLAIRCWAATGLLAIPLVLCFTDLGSVSWSVVVVGAAVGGAAVALRARFRPPGTPRRLGWCLDGAVVVLLLLAVPNVVIFGFAPEDQLERSIIQFHQNFFLGPANQVLAGDALLVDVLSQYGVGSIYFLSGAFRLARIGNGTLGLLEGLLSALMYIGTYATLRLAGVTRLVAAGAMAVGVTVLVYGLEYPLGGLLQHGAIRYGLPVGVIVGAVAEARRPRSTTLAHGLQLVTVAVASVWALESFVYTSLTAAACAALFVAIRPVGQRRREVGRWAGHLVAAVLAGHVVLAGITLVIAGELPRWGWYLDTLREFLVGPIGDLTYDFTSFSPGLAVGALYMASASALAVIVARRRDILRQQSPLVVAIGGVTAHGIALFSYLDNRSADHIIPYVCLPAIGVLALWLTLLGRPELEVPAAGRRVAGAVALAGSILLVAATWSSAEERYPQSALAHVVPGGPSLRAALANLRDLPELQPGAVEGAELLEEHLPGERRSIVLTSADLSVEILVRAERGSRVPLGDPWEDSFVPEGHLDALAAFVDELEVGDLALLDPAAREAFDAYQRDPTLVPLDEPGEGTLVPAGLAPLQKVVLHGMAQRFSLRTVVATEGGLEVVELTDLG